MPHCMQQLYVVKISCFAGMAVAIRISNGNCKNKSFTVMEILVRASYRQPLERDSVDCVCICLCMFETEMTVMQLLRYLIHGTIHSAECAIKLPNRLVKSFCMVVIQQFSYINIVQLASYLYTQLYCNVILFCMYKTECKCNNLHFMATCVMVIASQYGAGCCPEMNLNAQLLLCLFV